MKTMTTYKNLVKQVLSQASEEEKERLEAEIQLFESRGWEKYVVFIYHLLNDLAHCEGEDISVGTQYSPVMASYFLFKALHPTEGMQEFHEKFFDNVQWKKLLFHGPLCLELQCFGPCAPFAVRNEREAMKVLTKNVRNHGLHMMTCLKKKYSNNSKDEQKLIVVGTEIEKADVYTILEEEKNNFDSEKENLKKNVLVTMVVHEGL